MKAQELENKGNDELQKLLQDKKSRVVNLKINIVGGNVKNVRELREAKKDVSRIYTILNSKKEK
ncbi:MAG: 50S ribosomal protein L29 [Candidatus Spechtbacteria bacterium RIFCSPLOWO2_01_FULL_43_12]|uniref:Large ribosomal subunit protein uL29 n=1 Tax=Candidatus Spechtbacteria bacterium RIFCSPLOWO2_01_FULL_43_12 TaxID=1802162 RepID=A0A1G2HDP5_9BACT|nr:MAG: 50S ribosomal protein L29 [Candidatus Spechtbacteria bacterium RIFCSPLOWO2_01_FULL_43_12]